MVEVSVKIDLKGLEKKVSPQAFARGRLALVSQMKMDMERFVPKRKGELRSSAYTTNDSVVYQTPYARLRYHGKVRKGFFSDRQRRFFFANKERLLAQKPAPGTGSYWDRKASAIYMKRWEEACLKGMGIK
ncbi:capsid protein [Streptococcus suis]|nr:capsid protein [Streptococcus suis]